ncbi:MAG: PAS domain-containing sensor histidine kinase [Myxococcota bacterium]|nr:PAS domain-containing sensor histidine kinase [Myxococcota bacterium]
MIFLVQTATALVLALGLVLALRATGLPMSIRVAVVTVLGTLLAQQTMDLLELEGVAWADPIGDTLAGAVPFLWGALLLLVTDRFHLSRLGTQRAQTHSLIDDVPAAVALLDERGRVVRASTTWRHVFAPTGGAPPEATLDAMPADLALAIGRTLTEGGRATREAERVPGEDRWWSWRVAPWNEDGPAGALVMIEDVTERVRLQADRDSTQRLAVLGELAAGVAHDMNNLLTILQLNLAMLRDVAAHERPALTADALTSMNEAVELASTMTRGVLRLARAESSSERELVSLSTIVDDTVRLVRSTLLRRYELVSAVEGDATLGGNATRLQQMLLNLIVNARDAMPDGGRIDVVLTETEGEATLRVSDHGVGIAPSDQSRLFTPFFTTKGASGTGLGLSVVRAVVEEHRGRIVVDSTLGRGTTFSITLPTSAARSEPNVELAAQRIDPRSGPA